MRRTVILGLLALSLIGCTTGTPTPEPPSAATSAAPDSSEAQTPPAETIRKADPLDFRGTDYGGDDILFTTPSGNIGCRLAKDRKYSGCQSKQAPIPAGGEESCDGNEMYPASMLQRGYMFQGDDVVPSCFNQGFFWGNQPKVLEYASSVTAFGYTCTSREVSLTCTVDSTGHGFELSRETARSF